MPGGSVNGRPFRESLDSYFNTGIPCGNPRRYRSSEVTRMGACQRSGPVNQLLCAPVDNIETEADRRVKELVQKQLNTKITLKEQLSKRKEFTEGSIYKSSTDTLSGEITLADYQSLSNDDRCQNELKMYGLSEEEIVFKREHDGSLCKSAKKRKFGVNPEIIQQKLQDIDKKMEQKKQLLSKPDGFANAKFMSRQEMDLELAISHDATKSRAIKSLVTRRKETKSGESVNDPSSHIPQILDSIMQDFKTKAKNKRANRRRKRNMDKCDMIDQCDKDSDGDDQVVFGPHLNPAEYDIKMPDDILVNEKNVDMEISMLGNGKTETCTSLVKKLHGCIDPIPEDIIRRYKLSISDVKKMPRFQSYCPGEPNNVLYIKNLSPKVTEEDLVALFIRYQSENGPNIIFKLLSGRMRGQAFITFESAEKAQAAMALVNGYPYKGRPIIITYGNKGMA